MKASSAKAKGRVHQNWIAEKLRQFYPQVPPEDIRPTIMGEQGEDIKLSTEARKHIPLSIEAKRVETLQLDSAMKQARENAPEGQVPVVVFRKTRQPAYIVLEFETFLEMITKR